jgi:Flp pilus assembly pilin Flp
MNICSSVMRAMARWRFGPSDDEGQSLVEYALILVLMIVVCFSILGTLSATVDQKLFQVVQAMP